METFVRWGLVTIGLVVNGILSSAHENRKKLDQNKARKLFALFCLEAHATFILIWHTIFVYHWRWSSPIGWSLFILLTFVGVINCARVIIRGEKNSSETKSRQVVIATEEEAKASSQKSI